MLLELVHKFGAAFLSELEEAQYLGTELNSFPAGSCEITSQMLALYLYSNGINDVVYTRNQTSTLNAGSIHYWVIAENTIIDLTAHQFEEFKGHCFLPLDSEFHGRFEQLSEHKPDINSLYRQSDGQSYESFYFNVINRIKNRIKSA
ncbi:hypothetical protein [Pseudoalteromonas spongiae]|uniref:Uncharacterized protein n=1 Tax=Pseudoalteromonas spongiae TaxID=298657 RepID=A0ABU8EW80_9GAMM